MEPAAVGEAIELRLGELLGHHRDVKTQLAQGLEALIRHHGGGIEGAAEYASPEAAQLRVEERGTGVLTIAGEQEGKIRRQLLHPRDRGLELGEIDPAIEAAGQG